MGSIEAAIPAACRSCQQGDQAMRNARGTIRRPVCDSATVFGHTNETVTGRPAGPAPGNATRAGKTLKARIADLLWQIGEDAFQDSDAYAAEHGWTTTRTRAGLGRVYRDPRFDTLAACPSCRGAGYRDGEQCHQCSGTGRVVLCQSATAEGRRL
jgi:hypothetical protein